MTTRTPRTQRDSSETTRLEDLLRADAAAVIDDDLDDEASYQDFSDAASTPADRQKATQRPRSQVYSIRVPVEQLSQLRRLAKDRGTAPTAMMREWVLARLEAEIGASAAEDSLQEAHESPSKGEVTTERLERVATRLTDLTAQLTKMITVFAELVTAQSAAAGQPSTGFRVMPAYSGPLSTTSLHAYGGPPLPLGIWASAFNGQPEVTCESARSTMRYICKGLAELRSTVEDTSSRPGFSDFDLDTWYDAADDELSYP